LIIWHRPSKCDIMKYITPYLYHTFGWNWRCDITNGRLYTCILFFSFSGNNTNNGFFTTIAKWIQTTAKSPEMGYWSVYTCIHAYFEYIEYICKHVFVNKYYTKYSKYCGWWIVVGGNLQWPTIITIFTKIIVGCKTPLLRLGFRVLLSGAKNTNLTNYRQKNVQN
jgi:hypothetical protein